MNDIIRLLPDSVSNQIAAGEVVQRPASVVKELVENAIDASATHIQVVIKDAGRTLIQVIDNGKGMSETDARMAFERHATSKIQSANDLFALQTMGFRGEALASIAAIAHVELRTQQQGEELGTRLCIAGSEVETQESICGVTGSNFMVKNLFYNVPARRKFLKSNEREFLHILMEFQRIVLVNPDIHFELIRDNEEIFNLPPANLRQRIVKVFGKSANQQKSFNQQLFSVDVSTTLAKITGFIGKPESAKKRNDQQYFFVNGRYMRHPYFHKAIMQAYEALIPQGETPSYFIYFTVDPASIDINIHPTKTEIKFENEQALWPILSAAVKETLGRFSVAPTIDFDREDAPDIPAFTGTSTDAHQPQPKFNSSYNPFKSAGNGKPAIQIGWEKLYEGFEGEKENPLPHSPSEEVSFNEIPSEPQPQIALDVKEATNQYLHFKGKYILTSVKSGLMIIDQHQAHVRVLFDSLIAQISQRKSASQRVLFPEIVDFTPEEAVLLPLILDDLFYMGFELSDMGNHAYAINGIPSSVCNLNPITVIKEMLSEMRDTGLNAKERLSETVALSLAKCAAIPYNKPLTDDEIQHLVGQLFASNSPTLTPDGKPIVRIITDDEIDKLVKN